MRNDPIAQEIAADWGVDLHRIRHLNKAVIAEGTLPDGAEVILKIASSADMLAREAQVLQAANGRGYAKLYRADLTRRALLIERLGAPLNAARVDLEEHLGVVVSALQAAWFAPTQALFLPTCAQIAQGHAQGLKQRWHEARPCLESAVDLALACADRRIAAHDPDTSVVLHGDAHGANILRCGAGYKMIDPEGVVGEKAYDFSWVMRGWNLFESDLDVARALAERALMLGQMTGLEPAPIWEWGVLMRVSFGVRLHQMGQARAARELLAPAEAMAADVPDWHALQATASGQ